MLIDKNNLITLIDATRTQISDSGYAIVDQEWTMDRLPSSFSRLYFIHSGEGVIRYAGKNMLLRPNHMYLIPPNFFFDYICSNFMEKVFFHISVMLQNNFDLFDGLQQCYELPLEDGYTQKLIQSYHNKEVFRIQEAIFGALSRFSEAANVSSLLEKAYSPQNQAVFRYLEANLTSRLTVKQVAKSLSISESGLTKRFRAETGISPGKYVNLLIIQKAKHMLLHTNFSIGEIAEKLDFCDQFYFARFFRLKTGETPSLFRQRSLGES